MSDPSTEQQWAEPRLNFLERLIADAKNGDLPQGEGLKGIPGLEIYISKKLPGFDTIQRKLDQLNEMIAIIKGFGPSPLCQIMKKIELTEHLFLPNKMWAIMKE
jgi:hypothetical protein